LAERRHFAGFGLPHTQSRQNAGVPSGSGVHSANRDSENSHPGPSSEERGQYAPRPRKLGLKERWYPIQVKQKDKVGRPDIDAFEAMIMREDCEKGFFVSFDYSSDALQETESFFTSNAATKSSSP